MKTFNWNSEKNQDLIINRNVSYEQVIYYLENGGLIDDISHPNIADYPNQRIFIILIVSYVYLVPYVETDDEIFLKTIIPSRKFTRKYFGVKK